MLKIRLQRPFKNCTTGYHIVVTNSLAKRDGKFFEKIGSLYKETPSSKFDTDVKNYTLIRINKQRLLYWLKQGAQPTLKVKKTLKYM